MHMPKHKILEAKLHLRNEAESYSMVLKNGHKQSKNYFARDLTNKNLSFLDGDYKTIFCIGSFRILPIKYTYKHDDPKLHCSNVLNPWRHLVFSICRCP